MTGFPGSPQVVKGGIVLIDPNTSAVLRVIVLQYNPDTLNRTLQVQGAGGGGGGEGGERLEALRLKGPPVETIKLDAEIDAVDQLEFPTQNQVTVQLGIAPVLASLEMMVYPTTAQLESANRLAGSGTLEIAPAEAPLSLFVWSKSRILPVRVTEFSITEEAFDPALNPIRAKVSLGMRVLSVNDLSFSHKGSSLFLAYQQQKERMAGMTQGSISALGIVGVP